jgi:ribonuclease P protein component
MSQGAITLVYKKAATPRFTFVVSTAVDKRATVRNRMKRLLREAVRKVLPTAPRIDGVIVARKGMPDIQDEVDTLIHELFDEV